MNPEPVLVLLVEDNEDHAELRNEIPSLVLLDLRLPRTVWNTRPGAHRASPGFPA